MERKIWILALILLLVMGAGTALAGQLTPKEQLGQLIFNDEKISINKNQSCAACHGPAVGWTGPDEHINKHGAVYEGSISGRFGNSKPPVPPTPRSVLLFTARRRWWASS